MIGGCIVQVVVKQEAFRCNARAKRTYLRLAGGSVYLRLCQDHAAQVGGSPPKPALASRRGSCRCEEGGTCLYHAMGGTETYGRQPQRNKEAKE